MKVLLLNGSCRQSGCTYTALKEVERALRQEGVETEIVQIGGRAISDCVACGGCKTAGKCVLQEDGVNEFVAKARGADGFVFGTPVYFAHPDGRALCLLDRAFYSGRSAFCHKPAAFVASARRAGTTASLDALTKYASICEMPVISSTYWNMVHGNSPADVAKDEEGMQTMFNLGLNMAWILKCVELGKQNGVPIPATDGGKKTNFIR